MTNNESKLITRDQRPQYIREDNNSTTMTATAAAAAAIAGQQQRDSNSSSEPSAEGENSGAANDSKCD